MRAALAFLAAVRVAFALSPPLWGWLREHRRRLHSRGRPCNDFPARAYRR